MARDLSANKVPPEDYMKFLEKLGATIEQQGKETNDRIDDDDVLHVTGGVAQVVTD